jgi:hypothetical protein
MCEWLQVRSVDLSFSFPRTKPCLKYLVFVFFSRKPGFETKAIVFVWLKHGVLRFHVIPLFSVLKKYYVHTKVVIF